MGGDETTTRYLQELAYGSATRETKLQTNKKVPVKGGGCMINIVATISFISTATSRTKYAAAGRNKKKQKKATASTICEELYNKSMPSVSFSRRTGFELPGSPSPAAWQLAIASTAA